MKTSLRDYLDQRLAPLDWHGEDEVLRRLRPTRRLSPRAVAALCIALLLLSSTALAMTLTFSRRTAVLQRAREAVCAEYSLTGEQLDLFSAQVESVDGGWRVMFSSSSLSPDALGIYTVLLLGDQTQVTWSHDGEAPDPGSGLDASAWGPEQIQLAMRLRSANLAGWVSAEQDAEWQEPDDVEEKDAVSGDMPDLSLHKAGEGLIRKALEKYHGNRKLAAMELGISERTLYRKLKNLD